MGRFCRSRRDGKISEEAATRRIDPGNEFGDLRECMCRHAALGVHLEHGELVDLSHAYDAAHLYWPTSEQFRLERVSKA